MNKVYEKYFHRQIDLWGMETQKKLISKKVAIIGCGGLGCSIGISLGASGIGEFHLVDFDTVDTHNIHRQIAFKEGDEDRFKAHVLSELIEDRCSFTRATPHHCNFEIFSQKDISLDLIIDATDNLQTRSQIDKFAKEKNIPWIYGSVEEFNGQVCFFEKSNFNSFKITDKIPKGITAPMVMNIASLESNLALRYLADLEVAKDTLYYIHFNLKGELITQKFKMPT